MNLPKKVNICGLEYEVQEVELLRDVDVMGAKDCLTGQIDYVHQKIRIWSNNPSPQATFYHELIHGVLNSISEDEDEAFVSRLANVLYDTLSRNDLLKD